MLERTTTIYFNFKTNIIMFILKLKRKMKCVVCFRWSNINDNINNNIDSIIKSRVGTRFFKVILTVMRLQSVSKFDA